MGGNTIPGLYRVYDNNRVQTLKQSPWPLLLTLLGKSGESMMMDLLLDCSVFMYIETGKGNYYQISGAYFIIRNSGAYTDGQIAGEPVSDLSTVGNADKDQKAPSKESSNPEKSPSEINFVRSRMLYARAALNARGLVQFGLRHIRMAFILLTSHLLTCICRHPQPLSCTT